MRITSFIILIVFLILLFTSACKKEKKPIENTTISPPQNTSSITHKNTNSKLDSTITEVFVKQNIVDVPKRMTLDIRSSITQEDLKKLKGAELEMKMMQPIYSKIFDFDEDANRVLPHLTNGQKALYYYRIFNAGMTEGGIEGLFESIPYKEWTKVCQNISRIGNEELYQMTKLAATKYNTSRSLQVNGNEDLTKFYKDFNKKYSSQQNQFYKSLELYIQSHPEEFIVLTE